MNLHALRLDHTLDVIDLFMCREPVVGVVLYVRLTATLSKAEPPHRGMFPSSAVEIAVVETLSL